MEQAFGGYKMTGLGREGISTTLEEFSQVKNYIIQARSIIRDINSEIFLHHQLEELIVD
jgi:hypothetical protein